MKASLNAWTVEGSLGMEDMFRAVSRAGFDGIELNVDAPGAPHGLSMNTTEEDYAAIRSYSEKYSLPVVSISTSLSGGMSGHPERWEDYRRLLRKQIEAAKVYTPENRFLASFSFFKGASTLSRDLLVALIDRIEVGEGNRVNIKFRFQDEFLILNDYLRKEVTPDEYGSKVSPHIQ